MRRGLKCLVIEADPAEAARLAAVLRDLGDRAQLAASVARGLELLAATDFDLVLAGLATPATDGPGFFKTLREELGREDTAVIVVGPSPPESVKDEMDALDFLPAPADRQRLAGMVAWLTKDPAAGSPFPQREFERFTAHLERASGLVFDAKRRTLFEEALRRRMRLIGATEFEEYYRKLTASQAEEKRLVHLLTIGETSFFRNPAQFDVLRDDVLPRMRLAQEAGPRRIRLWSAACSTGEEPYTMAMTVLDVFPDADRWDIKILATDINLRSLAAARRGVYGERSLRATPASYLDRHFQRDPAGQLRVRDRVRHLVRFEELNLQTDSYPEGNAAVFCRNVLIYFNRENFSDAVRRLRAALLPEGALFLGHSENLLGLDLGLSTVHTRDTYYYVRSPEDDQEPHEHLTPHSAGHSSRIPTRTPRSPKAAPPAGGGSALERLAIAAGRQRPGPGGGRTAETAAVEPPAAKPAAARRHGSGKSRASEAEEEFEPLLARGTGSPHELVGKGFLAANRGDSGGARRCAEAALGRDPLLAEAHFLMGVLQADAGDISTAIECFNRALFLNPEIPMAHYHLAHLRARESRVTDARRSFENAIELLERGVNPDFHGGFPTEQLLTICRQGLEKLVGSGGK